MMKYEPYITGGRYVLRNARKNVQRIIFIPTVRKWKYNKHLYMCSLMSNKNKTVFGDLCKPVWLYDCTKLVPDIRSEKLYRKIMENQWLLA